MADQVVSGLPARVLMTVDRVGGVWRYGVDLARGLEANGVACLLVGFGPRVDGAADREIVWTGEPLDWLVRHEAELDGIPARLGAIARDWRADLLHLNLPSQAAGLPPDPPVVAVSHSCVPSWWQAVRGAALPPEWAWQQHCNRRGLDRADAVLTPSQSHADALLRLYGPIDGLRVVRNATVATFRAAPKQAFVLAAGRWWDEGKNAAMLDRAAAAANWPIRMAGSLAGPDGQTVSLDHATALGDLAADALTALMRSCGIFASASRYEPFGLAVLEAAVQQAALVLSDIPTFRELWQGAALFVPPDDARGFADAINRLAADPTLRRRLGHAAGLRAAGLQPRHQLLGVLAAYADAMARHPRASGRAG